MSTGCWLVLVLAAAVALAAQTENGTLQTSNPSIASVDAARNWTAAGNNTANATAAADDPYTAEGDSGQAVMEWYYSPEGQRPDVMAPSRKPSCPPGQGRPSETEECQACPYGRYSPVPLGVRGRCLKCPQGTVTISTGATECGCKPGYGTLTTTTTTAGCRPCPNGTYSPGGSLSPCTRCPGSAYMVTPPRATRVNQCTCKAGFGSTTDFPYSCQMCPRGTYANGLAEISAVPGVPVQGGKGITAGLVGATFVRCTPCCPAGVGTCGLTTMNPGSTSYAACVISVPPAEQYCCGVAGSKCTYVVPPPPFDLPSDAILPAAAVVAAAEPPAQQSDGSGSGAAHNGASHPDDAGHKHDAQQTATTAQTQESDPNKDSRVVNGTHSDSDSAAILSSSDALAAMNSAAVTWDAGSSASNWTAARDRAAQASELAQDSVALSSQDIAPLSGSVFAGLMTACSTEPRVAVASYDGIAANTPWLVAYFLDPSPTTSCQYKVASPYRKGCTGNQLAPYLVLTAAHCVDPLFQAARSQPGCGSIVLDKVVLCYAFPRAAGQMVCSNGINAIGVSYRQRKEADDPNDHAIVFIGSPRPGPFYQYNYIENFPRAFSNSTLDRYEELSYVADGTTTECGCVSCPTMPCGLGQTGPTRGPLTKDPEAPLNGAVSAKLEACQGSSGGCLSVNGAQCCVAVLSYEYATGSACGSACNSNFWSSVSRSFPLSKLWSTIMVPLPHVG